MSVIPIIQPYPHQNQALSAIFSSIEAGNNPLASLPTGSGKSLVAAWLAIQFAKQGSVLNVAPVKELVKQNTQALFNCGYRNFSIYCAGLKSKNLSGRVVFASINSIYKARYLPDFKFIIIDEAHRVSRKFSSMFQKLRQRYPNATIVGLTATPYRLDSGMLHEGEGAMFNDLCIHIKPQALIPQYLCPLRGINAINEQSIEGVHVRRGEFIEQELEQVVLNEEAVEKVVQESILYMRNHVLFFAVTIRHAEMLMETYRREGVKCDIVTGSMKDERTQNDKNFKAGKLQVLGNVKVYTEGYDFPAIDTLFLYRHTMSKNLLEQMLGRGMRKHHSKDYCLVGDFAGNLLRHGAIGELESFEDKRKAKEAKEQLQRPPQKRGEKIYTELDKWSDPLNQGQVTELPVRALYYKTLPASKQKDKTNVIAIYDCGLVKVQRWLCPEYDSNARFYAHNFLKTRGYEGQVITDAQEFVKTAKRYKKPFSISAQRKGKFYDVKIEHFER